MRTHQEQALALFKQGYNCSQAVFAAFCDETGLDAETALKISSSFGGGMGRMREVCGAVSGMFMVAGMQNGCTDPKNAAAKAEHYKLIQALAAKFKEANGSIICRELLEGCPVSAGPSPEGAPKKPACDHLVQQAAQIVDDYLAGRDAAPAPSDIPPQV